MNPWIQMWIVKDQYLQYILSDLFAQNNDKGKYSFRRNQVPACRKKNREKGSHASIIPLVLKKKGLVSLAFPKPQDPNIS